MQNNLISVISRYNKNWGCQAIRTFIALSLSVTFIWIVGYFFCNSLTYYEYDRNLEKYIHAPGSITKHRSEGIATTYNGLFGIQGISDITKIDKNKIIVWGLDVRVF
jgi:hypothetical protein